MNTDLLIEILAGGLLGLMGQGVRLAAGLKKLQISNLEKIAGGNTPDDFDAARLFISLFIGFLAGALALVLKILPNPSTTDIKTILPIMAAGYAGADFIESVFNTYFSKIKPAGQTDPDTPGKPNTGDAQKLTVNDESKN